MLIKYNNYLILKIIDKHNYTLFLSVNSCISNYAKYEIFYKYSIISLDENDVYIHFYFKNILHSIRFFFKINGNLNSGKLLIRIYQFPHGKFKLDFHKHNFLKLFNSARKLTNIKLFS